MPELRELLISWELALKADRRSAQTIKSYTEGVKQYVAFAEARKADPLSRATWRAFCVHLGETGREAATVRARQLGVRRFTSWLAEEDELSADPFIGVKAPKLDQKVIGPLTADQLKALLRACRVPSEATAARKLRAGRDEAILRLMIETCARAGEVVAIHVDDVDLRAQTLVIRRGKGGKGTRRAVRPADRAGNRPLHAPSPGARSRFTARVVARGSKQGVLVRCAAQDVAPSCGRGRHRGVPPSPPSSHRRAPLARSRRQ